MFRLLFIAVFSKYQYLKMRAALLYSLSVVTGEVHEAIMLRQHQIIVLH